MTRYGVLISNRENDEKLGFLELDPTGMVITAAFEGGINPHSLGKLVDRLLDQPIYKKYADVLSRDKVLSPELLVTVTEYLADLINNQSMTLSGVSIVARSVSTLKERGNLGGNNAT